MKNLMNRKGLRKTINLSLLFLSTFYCNLLEAHPTEYEDLDRYRFVFEKYSSIKKFVNVADAFSEEHRHSFMKQKVRNHGDFYVLEIRDSVFKIDCTNIGFSLEMYCRESRIKGLKDDSICTEKWDFKDYLKKNGFEIERN